MVSRGIGGSGARPALEQRSRDFVQRRFGHCQSHRAAAEAAKRRFNGHQFNRRWTTSGQSARLLSLGADTLYFTGGAYPSHGSDGLLWDRLARRTIKAESLFRASGDLEKLVHDPFCVTLGGERAKRRGTAVPVGDASSDCPKLSELAVLPADSNANRRFDRFRIIAPPGAVGVAEGRYDVAIPVTAELRAALKPAYRSSFEIQPQ